MEFGIFLNQVSKGSHFQVDRHERKKVGTRSTIVTEDIDNGGAWK
jgi:hypothetical protein